MTHFEYISVAVSIVLSLGVVRLLDAIRYAFQPVGRYTVLVLWIVVKLMNHLLFWWSLWSYRDFAHWNILVFAWILLFPVLLYLQVTSLVTTAPQNVADWRTHYHAVRVWFLSANVLIIIHAAVTASLVLAQSSLFSILVAQSLLLAINVAGLLSANPRVQLVVVWLALAGQVFGFGSIFFTIGEADVG